MSRSIGDDGHGERSYLAGVGKILVHLAVPLMLALAAWALIVLGVVKLAQAVFR